MRKSAINLIIAFFLVSCCFSQELQITTYSPREGIPVYGVNSIFQDRDGWMWFTTGYEVMRYDGHRFRTFVPAKGVVMDFCFKIIEVNGEIWVVSSPYALKVSGDSLRKLDVVSTSTEFIDHIQSGNRSFFLLKDGLYELRGRAMHPLITNPNINIRSSESLIPYNDSLFVSHQMEKSLIVFNLSASTLQMLPLAVTDMRKNEKNQIYLQVPGTGIIRIVKITTDANELNVLTEPVILASDPKYRNFVIDGLNNIWTYNIFNYLVKLDTSGKERIYSESHGLPSLWFNQLFVDREKNLWIGFNSGLCKIRNTSWDRYTIKEALYSNHILFFSDGKKPGQVFIGTQNGLNFFDNGQMKRVTNKAKPFYCTYIVDGGSEHYYIKDSFLYSGVYDPVKVEIHSEKLLANIHFIAGQIIPYKDGLFISTIRGIFLYQGNVLTRASPDSFYYRYMMIDRTGRLWGGEFASGLHCYRIFEKEGSFQLRKLFFTDSVSSTTPRLVAIRSMSEGMNGEIFVGTRNNGLFILTMQKDEVLSTKYIGGNEGLRSNTIWGLSKDPEGGAWVATMKGIRRIRAVNNEWVVIDEGTKRELYQSVLVFTDAADQVWVANHPGVVVIRKEGDKLIDSFAVDITGLNIDGNPVEIKGAGGHQRLKYRDNDVHIEFSSNTYRDERTVLYSWRLNDKSEWSEPAPLHSINYSALGPGKYHFSVKAVNAEGQWSSNVSSFGFVVLPPFWQQVWFIAAIIAVIALGLYALYRYRMKRLKELYEMRNMIARDLHDEIGSTLTSINILSNVSLRNLHKDDHRSAELLDKVIDQSQQIQQNMSDIVWAIKPDNDRLENMTVRMREYLSHTLEPKNIEIEFHAEEVVLQASLSMQERRDFFLIFKEAINNIAKYSQCTQTVIRLTQQNSLISLLIKDNGIGFKMERIHSTNGLKNMKQRAELIKGSLRIVTAPGKGTEVELLVPAT